MNSEKTAFGITDDTLTVSMPMQKIDKENRRVSGWATLDNLDLQGDIVLREASEKAFSRSRMNVREMHQPKAVGRILSWRPETYTDVNTGETHSGIYVDVYVSKGAEDTWQKVLDGTLQAFSIKGPIRDAESAVSKGGKSHRIIKDYDLEELSLVDSGGNQLANVVSFQKINGDTLVSGMVTEVVVENVYFCETDGVAKFTTDEATNCVQCGDAMENIGWYEGVEGENNTQKMLDVVAKFRGSSELASNQKEEISKEVNGTMTDEQKTTTEETKVEETKVETVEPVEEAPAEEAVEVDETEGQEDDLVKMVTELKDLVIKTSAETAQASEKRYEELEKRVDEIQKNISEKIELSDKRGEDLAEKFNSLHNEFNTLTKRLGEVEDDTAVKKSSDLGGSQGEVIEKSNDSLWRGTFLGARDL